jgi:hypothetical protein
MNPLVGDIAAAFLRVLFQAGSSTLPLEPSSNGGLEAGRRVP